MSASTSKISSNQNTHISSTNKQSIPLPINAHINHLNPTAHTSQIPAHFALHQKNHGVPQSQKQQLGPPRYQPPPPPNGSILKNVSPQRSGIPTLSYQQAGHTVDTNPHLSLKFPQEVPKLTNICIPPDRSNSRIATTRTLNSRQSLNSIAQQPSPHPSAADDEHTASIRATQDMLKFVRKNDGDSVSAHSPNPNVNGPTANNMIRMASVEQNRHFQSLVAELRTLKEANQRLSDDNQELRDLCCFLDDDRQKGRKLAREWQRFGRYTASVMRQEVSAYQNKLRQLDDKQQELIRDNLELKELCLYLDEERASLASNIPTTCTSCGASVRATSTATSHLRDDGDGSSSSTNDEPMPSARHLDRPISDQHLRSALNDQTLQYVRMLERRLIEHELTNGSSNRNGSNENAAAATVPSLSKPSNVSGTNENGSNNNNNNNNNSSSNNSNKSISNNNNNNGNNTNNGSKATENGLTNGRSNDILSGRPEAVVRALQILEVREQLERDRAGNPTSMSPEHMDDGEKALLREMCNVVWRKLEDHPNNQDPN